MGTIQIAYKSVIQLAGVLFIGIFIYAAWMSNDFAANSPFSSAPGPVTKLFMMVTPISATDSVIRSFTTFPEWATNDDRNRVIAAAAAYRRSDINGFFREAGGIMADVGQRNHSPLALFPASLGVVFGTTDRDQNIGVVFLLSFFSSLTLTLFYRNIYNVWYNPFYHFDSVKEAVKNIGLTTLIAFALFCFLFLLFIPVGIAALGMPSFFFGFTEIAGWFALISLLLYAASYAIVPGMIPEIKEPEPVRKVAKRRAAPSPATRGAQQDSAQSSKPTTSAPKSHDDDNDDDNGIGFLQIGE
jgi:hypothetical protein